MLDFKNITIRPTTGTFDTLSSKDEIGFGGWRLVKNAVTRSSRNRQRAGGWRRLFADENPYNNSDLHDQLTDRLGYYDSFSAHAMFGGGLSGYGYPYFAPSYTLDGPTVFPPPTGPYCPVYIGDFPSGLYNGCPIFYPSVGYPYDFIAAFVNATGAREHWRFDEIAATTPGLFGGLDLTNFGPTIESGLIGNALSFSGGKWLQATNAAYQAGDIRFGFTGFIKRNSSASTYGAVLGQWGLAGSRKFQLYMQNGQLTFRVSDDGTTITTLTNPTVLTPGEWSMFACWHDPVANTINLRIDDGAAASTPHSTGVVAGSSDFFVGFDDGASLASLDASLDSLTFWKNAFPTTSELDTIFNASLGLDYPFSSGICNTGEPFYYAYSSVYTSCPVAYPDTMVPGYGYGPTFPLYSPRFDYDYTYCGDYLWRRPGCREAVTLLDEIITSGGRKLIAGTMSRVYEYNQSSGSWRILADGLGVPGYSSAQCGCNRIRGMSATLGAYLLYTNNVDPPMIYLLGDEAIACNLNALQPITDLVALGIQRAGGVVTWKGFTFFYDITENGERKGGEIIWSDLEDPNSFIESDTSFAGRATIAVGATILNAAPLGNWLIFYTDRGIIRVSLVGGEDVFNFEDIYQGENALRYKFSLIDAGDMHLYAGESDVYAFTQFDTRPISIPWITRAAGFIFNGIEEDDATYSPINKDACELVTGGWNGITKEAYLSWPTGDEVCPIVTLRMNLKFNTADFIDHGFTAFLTFRADSRPTVGEWLEDMGLCPRGSKVATGFKDGEVCEAGTAVANPPLYIRNPTEDPDLPVHPQSLCAQLAGKTLDDFCVDCLTASTFIMASAVDFTLKQAEDSVYYREMLGGSLEDYDSYACGGGFYSHVGYSTVMQSGSEQFRSEDEKMEKRIRIEAEALPQSSPSNLECEVGFSPVPNCTTWKETEPQPFECISDFSAAQHAANGTRPDGSFNFPTWTRGVYLSFRFRISGVGGGGTFSAVHQTIKGWGQVDNP